MTRVSSISGSAFDPDTAFSDACEPLTEIPSWWAGFLFHVLNPRQLSLYLYLSLLSGPTGSCHPTTKQIRNDLGIASLTIVFEAMAALEAGGFISRRRRNFVELKSRRNVYHRPSCEFTVLRLLQLDRIDALLRPVPGEVNEMSVAASDLRDRWLANVLGSAGSAFQAADMPAKRAMLIDALGRLLRGDDECQSSQA